MTESEARKTRPLSDLRKILVTASPRRRLQLIVTLLVTAAAAGAELVTVGAVLPVLAIAAAPDSMAKIPFLGPALDRVADWFGASTMVAAAVLLTFAALGATVIRLSLTWVSQKFVFGLQQDLLMIVYGRALRQPYDWYVRQNSSVLLSGLEKINIVIVGIIAPLVLALTSAAMALCVTFLLFLIDPVTALFAALSIGCVYISISLGARATVRTISVGLNESREARVRGLQEILGGIRDIILDRTQPLFEARMLQIEERQRSMMIVWNFISSAPRLIVEGTVIVLVAAMATWFSLQPGGVLRAIPVLGALALGAQRLLPMIQSIYLGLSSCSVHSASLADVVGLIEAPVESAFELSSDQTVEGFSSAIELRHAGYTYVGGREALRDINMTIRKGERIGLIGKTGSGKSTLVDILMGLLPPTAGRLLVDGKPIGEPSLANWKAQIAHVPQAIFLIDSSIAENIAFGRAGSDVDHGKVAAVARQAGLTELIDSLPDGLATSVGERGVRLSGGQRQRIGIARALYKCATVLVLDEATSALDDETEIEVMRSVANLTKDLTVIIIAHRLSTTAACDRIYRLEAGKIVDQGNFMAVVDRGQRTAT